MTHSSSVTPKEFKQKLDDHLSSRIIRQIKFTIPSPDPENYPNIYGIIRHDPFMDKLWEGLVMMDTNFIPWYQIVWICSQSFYVRAKRKWFEAAVKKFEKKSAELAQRLEMYSTVESWVDKEALLAFRERAKNPW